MSSSVSPTSLLSRTFDPQETEGLNACRGCGAPLHCLAHSCSYCQQQTPHGARQARLGRLGSNQGPKEGTTP